MALCICGVCIPYSAVFALLTVVLKPIVTLLVQIGVVPEWLARRLGIYIVLEKKTAESHVGEKNTNTCCKVSKGDSNDTTLTETAPGTDGQITWIQSQEHWDSTLSSCPKVIVKFTASWCKPCKMIHPLYEKLASENRTIQFCTVDVDDQDDVARACSISAMPTFILFHHGKKVSSIQGASEVKLKTFVAQAN